MTITCDDIIAYGRQKHGGRWVARLARDLNYSTPAVYRIACGERTTVSRRMELEMRRLIREDRVRDMTRPAADGRS